MEESRFTYGPLIKEFNCDLPDINLIRDLLRRGSDINGTDSCGLTPLLASAL